MVELKHVGKTYHSKNGQTVEALSDINLTIGDRGFVFILGKSGSGKSTLLNILGGLDSAASGDVSVDGVSFAAFRQADYDAYRNRYVGFIFQEFNLLSDFDVKGNVALALRLSGGKDVSEKARQALQKVGLTENYLSRRIGELSGGEKQRVALARAIVKDSRIILADEPTGNLDSGTGESIWNILKELSKTRLVIAVSHDRESAERYADRIVELADGHLCSDSGMQAIVSSSTPTATVASGGLSGGVCCQMGLNNLLRRKGKSVSVILISVFTIFVILLLQLLYSFSSERAFARFIGDNHVDHIVIQQGRTIDYYGVDQDFMPSQVMRPSTLDYVSEYGPYIRNGVVNGKQHILDMGFSFVGEALELDETSYYITNEVLEREYRSEKSYVLVDGEWVKLVREEHPVEFLLGKTLDISISIDSTQYCLAGVVDIGGRSPLLNSAFFPEYFAREEFTGRRVGGSTQQNVGSAYTDVEMQFGEAHYRQAFSYEDVLSLSGNILTEDGLVSADALELAEDEVVLTYDMYAALFPADPQWYYVDADVTEYYRIPVELGQRFDLAFSVPDRKNEAVFRANSLKLAGIKFLREDERRPGMTADQLCKLTVGGTTGKRLASVLTNTAYTIVRVSEIENVQRFLVDFRKEHEGYVCHIGADESTDYADFIYGFEEELSVFKLIFLAIAIILGIVLILLVVNLISFSIADRKKEIGILSALGARNKDIVKIFLSETALISVITFAVNFVLIVGGVLLSNYLFTLHLLLRISLLQIDVFTFLTMILASFVLLLFAALLPLRRIIRLKPIDAIRNL